MPVILGEHVTLEAGTGAVHTAPGHGQEDFASASATACRSSNPVGNDGRFLPDTPLVGGMKLDEAQRAHHRGAADARPAAASRAAISTAIRIAGGTRRR